MYAVDDLGDAVDVTRAFLSSLDVRSWLALVLVVFFVAGLGFSAPPAPSGDPTADEEFGVVWERTTADVDAELEIDWDRVSEVARYAAAAAVACWLVFSLFAAIMEFVLLESLRRGEVAPLGDARATLGRALRLFGFRLAFVLLGVGLVAVAVRSALADVGGWTDLTPAGLTPALLLAAGYYLCYRQLDRLTTAFVAPVMLLEGRGVLSGWRRVWPTFVAEWREYAVYLLLVWLCRLLVGIAITAAAFLAALAIGIPSAAVLVALVVFAGSSGFLPAAIVVLGAVFLLGFVVTLLRVPVESYFRYYQLLLLGDTNAEFDLIRRRRAAVREGDGGDESVGGIAEGTGGRRSDWHEDGWADSSAPAREGRSSEWGYADEGGDGEEDGEDRTP